jgi:hypothetical protein
MRKTADLQVVWELRTTRVTGVHCNEDSTGRLEAELNTLKHESVEL